jgi:hypothetical protein
MISLLKRGEVYTRNGMYDCINLYRVGRMGKDPTETRERKAKKSRSGPINQSLFGINRSDTRPKLLRNCLFGVAVQRMMTQCQVAPHIISFQLFFFIFFKEKFSSFEIQIARAKRVIIRFIKTKIECKSMMVPYFVGWIPSRSFIMRG